MKLISTILSLLFWLSSSAQVPILREYRCDILRDSTLYVYTWVNGIGGKLMPVPNHKFVEGDGGLYNALYRKANGDVYIIEGQGTTPRFLQYDTLNIPFKAIAIECHLQTNLAVRSDGTIWISGHDTGKWLTTDANKKMNRWAKIPGQPAVKFKAVAKGGANGNGVLVAVADNGDVWLLYDQSTQWIKKVLPGPVQKIYASESNFYIALIDGQPYGWGQLRYLTGITGTTTGYVSLTSYWDFKGKIIDIAVNGQTVHYIDDQHRLWGYGDNMQGEVGIGEEWVNRREIMAANKWKQYVWPWVTATMSNYYQPAFISKPVQIAPGTLFARVFGGGYYSFYKYAQDTNGNLYSWGRNKSGVLSNGLAVSNESELPNWGDKTKPELVNLNYVIPVPSLFVPGTVSAGRDTSIISNSFTLIGASIPGKSKNFSYTITDWEWTKLSGPECTIENPVSATANVIFRSAGISAFQLKVTDNNGATMTDTINVTVTIPNKPPAIEIFCSKVTVDKSIIIVGKATDTDGTITSTEWDKISGPAGDAISDIGKDVVEVSFSQPGEYTYRFSAFDDRGASSIVDVTLIVYEVEAGAYIIIRKK